MIGDRGRNEERCDGRYRRDRLPAIVNGRHPLDVTRLAERGLGDLPRFGGVRAAGHVVRSLKQRVRPTGG